MPSEAPQQQRVLVTGAAGFIGFHLVQRLLGRGVTVLGIDNLNDYYDVNLKKARLAILQREAGLDFERMDLTNYDGVRLAFSTFRPDYVVHLAAQAGVRHSLINPRAYVAANLDGFLSILEACRAQPVRHLIYASSSSVYGANAKVPFHEDDPVLGPVSLYAATKRANELMAHSYAHLYGIPCSGLRFFTVYGPWGRPDMAYYTFTKAIDAGEPIRLFNHGRMRRDFTYVDDVTSAIARLLDLPPVSTGSSTPQIIYNVGNYSSVELLSLVAAIESALGKKAKTLLLPMQPGDVPVTFADIARLKDATGFVPETSIEDGIAKFVSWYRAFHDIAKAAS